MKTRDEYAPIHRQLADALAHTGDAPGYFRELISKNLNKFDMGAILPSVGVKWIKSEPEVERVTVLIGDETDLKKSLDESEEIVHRLEKAMTGPGRVNIFPELASARAHAVAISNECTEVKQQLAGRMSKIIDPVAGGDEGQLKQLEQERDSIEAKLRTLPVSADSIADRQKKAREQFNELDRRVVELQTQLNGTRASAVATRKFYEDQVQATLPVEQRANAKAEIDGFIGDVESQGDESDRLRKELDDAKSSVGVDDADMQQASALRGQYDDILRRLHDLDVRVRQKLSQGDREKAEQIESILDRARAVQTKVNALNGRIDRMLDDQLKEIEASVDDEKLKVSAYRKTLGGYTDESADVGGGIVADNFKAVTQRFYNVVVRADVGIIDVAWALKESSTHESTKLLAERKRELKLLDDQFKEVTKDQP
jgi:hypothetical protein